MAKKATKKETKSTPKGKFEEARGAIRTRAQKQEARYAKWDPTPELIEMQLKLINARIREHRQKIKDAERRRDIIQDQIKDPGLAGSVHQLQSIVDERNRDIKGLNEERMKSLVEKERILRAKRRLVNQK